MGKNIPTAILLFVGTCLLVCSNGKEVITSHLQKRFLDGDTQNVVVSFTQSMQPIFDQINQMNFSSDGEKRTAQTAAQEEFTEEVQAGLKSFLDGQGVQSESFWISNQMYIPDADEALVTAIANFPGVSKVEDEPMAHIDLPQLDEPQNRAARDTSDAWGIQRIWVRQVWEESGYQGEGIIVANIDTGVRHTHESLRGRWRQSYGWYDPADRTRTPYDPNGHGTHTMGTIAGTHGVGVAPRATWIACKAGDGNNRFSWNSLLSCGQWIQCPTDTNGNNKNCNMAPNVVSNSWSFDRNGDSYDNVIQSWKNAGIIPVFSMGNSGPNCNTGQSPADRKNVIGVGSTEPSDKISSFSSLGPASDGRIKPDVSAPGTDVYSAAHWNDQDFTWKSGTSMACPHVAGVVALMKQKRPSLNFDQIYEILTRTPFRTMDTSTAKTCGGRPGNSYPNNVFGYGLINAVDALNAS